MEPIETITYKIIAMRNQRPHENTEAVLRLFDDHVEWLADFDADEPKSDEQNDHSMGWEKVHSYYHIIVTRENISSIEMEFQQTPEKYAQVDKDKWGVYIVKPGQEIKMWFRSKAKAEEIFFKLKEWLLNNKP